MSLFDRRLPISHCRWLGLAECTERLNPPPLPYGKELACQIQTQSPYPQIQICRSLPPLKSPPTGPAHSARPTQNHPRADFVIFISLGTRRAKCKKNMPAKPYYEFASKVQAATCIFACIHVLPHSLFIFFQKCAPRPRWEAHF